MVILSKAKDLNDPNNCRMLRGAQNESTPRDAIKGTAWRTRNDRCQNEGDKAMTPNLPKPMRIAYFAMGVILVISPLLLNLHPWIRVGAPIMGVLAILNAATGW